LIIIIIDTLHIDFPLIAIIIIDIDIIVLIDAITYYFAIYFDCLYAITPLLPLRFDFRCLLILAIIDIDYFHDITPLIISLMADIDTIDDITRYY
jgi:hypothetical protein